MSRSGVCIFYERTSNAEQAAPNERKVGLETDRGLNSDENTRSPKTWYTTSVLLDHDHDIPIQWSCTTYPAFGTRMGL